MSKGRKRLNRRSGSLTATDETKRGTMTITYKLLADGGFVAGDTESRLSSYAYPSSVYAQAAKRRPEKTAKEMIEAELWRNGKVVRTDTLSTHYDISNWEKLNA